MRRALALLSLLLAAAPSGAAQEAPRDTFALSGVTVTAARTPQRPIDAAARVTRVTAADFEATGSASVAEALAARTGLAVRRYGPSGLASLSVRGTGAGHALVLLDGHPLSDPQLGQLDANLLPTVLLDRVEVLHGAAAGLYGSAALGGVVHLRTLQPGRSPTLRLGSTVGTYGERRLSVASATAAGPLALVVAGEWQGGDDDYAVPTRPGQADARRLGWDHARATLYASAQIDGRTGRLRAGAWWGYAERGLGGGIQDTALGADAAGEVVGARQWDRHLRAWADAARFTTWGRVEAGGLVQRASLRYANPYPAPVGRADGIDDTGRTLAASGYVRTHLTSFANWQGTLGLDAGVGRAQHPSLAADATDRRAALALSATRLAGRVRPSAALRVDGYAPAAQPRRLVVSPQAGVNVQPLADLAAFRLKARAARAFRMPTLNDRYWQPGGQADLRPEQGWTLDLGVAWGASRFQAELTGYASWLRDQIVWRPVQDGAASYYAPENLARTRTLGLEASAQAALLAQERRTLTLGGVLAITDARDRTDPTSARYGEQLRYVPRWTARAWAAATLGTPATGALSLDLGLRTSGRSPVTADGSQWLDAYTVLDAQLRATRDLGGVRATLAVGLDNVTDTAYALVRSYPMPPRHARLRLLLELD